MQIKFLTVAAVFACAATFVHASPLVKRDTPEEDAQKARLEYVQKDPALQAILEYEVQVIVANLNEYDQKNATAGGSSTTTTTTDANATTAPPPTDGNSGAETAPPPTGDNGGQTDGAGTAPP